MTTYHVTIPAIRLRLPDRRGRVKRDDLIGCYVKMTERQIRAGHPRWIRYCRWREHVWATIRAAPTWPRALEGARCRIRAKVYWGHGRRGDSVNVLKSIEDVFNGRIWDDDRDVAGEWDHPETDLEAPRVEVELLVE